MAPVSRFLMKTPLRVLARSCATAVAVVSGTPSLAVTNTVEPRVLMKTSNMLSTVPDSECRCHVVLEVRYRITNNDRSC